LFGKRVLNISEDKEKVTVQTADNSEYTGDILVGADGAYSAVRQRLYERLKQEGSLPSSDQEDLPFSCTCLVGQTDPLDPEEFPELKDPDCHFVGTLGNDRPYTWTLFSTASFSVCWMVMHHLDSVSTKLAHEQRFRQSENSEWGSYAAQTMCDETRDFPIPFGKEKMTLGDLYDRTPKDLISKVMLEEKVFKTWHHGRTVLIGDGKWIDIDHFMWMAQIIGHFSVLTSNYLRCFGHLVACHKFNPSGGQGESY
jgi:2-polyprenyl-6-methoxyphenol hydroxylase-like FAD-dependent oxidoreductase